MSRDVTEGGGVTRLSFLKAGAGVAAGAAAVGVPAAAAAVGVPAAAALSEEKGRVIEPSTPTPREPVVAYIRDAERGELTLVAGTNETTYRDKALVKRLLAAAPKESLENGGGFDVLAP